MGQVKALNFEQDTQSKDGKLNSPILLYFYTKYVL